MDKKTRTTIIIGLIVTFLIVPLVTWFVLSQQNGDHSQPTQTQPEARSNEEITDAIIESNQGLSADNGPIFTISDVKIPQTGWYIVTIHTNDDPEGRNPAKVLLYDYGQNGGLRVMLGPGTSFPQDVTQPLGIPDAITRELNA